MVARACTRGSRTLTQCTEALGLLAWVTGPPRRRGPARSLLRLRSRLQSGTNPSCSRRASESVSDHSDRHSRGPHCPRYSLQFSRPDRTLRGWPRTLTRHPHGSLPVSARSVSFSLRSGLRRHFLRRSLLTTSCSVSPPRPAYPASCSPPGPGQGSSQAPPPLEPPADGDGLALVGRSAPSVGVRQGLGCAGYLDLGRVLGVELQGLVPVHLAPGLEHALQLLVVPRQLQQRADGAVPAPGRTPTRPGSGETGSCTAQASVQRADTLWAAKRTSGGAEGRGCVSAAGGWA